MPIIAESPPLHYGEGDDMEPSPLPPSPTIPVSPPAVIIKPPGACNLADILANHKVFIGHVDQLGDCFSRKDMPELSDQDFELHKEIAIVDKYITKNGDMYCSKQAVNNLSDKLKRFQDL